jgi:prolipoprotein diacylglyceryltransferase
MGAVRHPIPLYESVLGVALFAFALVLYRRRLPAGALALAAGMFYLVGRSLLDMLRATGVDGADPRILGGMTLTQTISIFVVPAMAAGLWWVAKRRRVATTVPA